MKLVECIADLLKYDPDLRLTSQQCVDHPYLAETTPLNNPPGPPGSQTATNGNGLYARANGVCSARSLPSVTPRSAPPSHSHNSLPGRPEFEPQPALATVQIPEVSSSHRSSFYESRSHAPSEARGLPTYPQDAVHGVRVPNGVSPSQSQAPSEYSNGWPSYASDSHGAWDPMDISPQVEIPPDGFPHSMDIQTSPMVREHPQRPAVEDPIQNGANGHMQEAAQQASTKLGKFSFTKKTSKWGLGMFGHGDKGQQGLPPVQEIPGVGSASSTPSLKRTQSSSTDSRSLSELSPLQEVPRIILDPKERKKEAARIQRDAEKQRRLLAEKTQKEQARAVMEKSKRIRDSSGDFEWRSTHAVALLHGPSQAYTRQMLSGKQPAAAAGPIRQTQSHGVSSFSAAGGSFASPTDANPRGDWRRDERVAKARRRDYDDDHSMSSTDLPSGVSVISFATVDSDPGPARLRHRPSALGISRMTSMSSLGTTMSDEFSPHARSSTSLAMEQQFANDFHLRASVDSSSISDGGSPAVAPLHMLSLSSPIPWAHQENGENTGERPSLNIPPQPKHPSGFQPQGPFSPYEHGQGNGLGYPSSPGVAPKSAINPMFKVVSLLKGTPFKLRTDNERYLSRQYPRRSSHDQAHYHPSPTWKLSRRASTRPCRRCPLRHQTTWRTTTANPSGACLPLLFLAAATHSSSWSRRCCISWVACRISRSFLVAI